MLKVGLVGLGSMGNVHLQRYLRLEGEGIAKVVAICDVDQKKHRGVQVEGNISVGEGEIDFSGIKFYHDYEEMIEKEALDYVDLCLPTFLHAPYSIKGMSLGLDVFCEKPMALSSAECAEMIAATKEYDKQLMIGQTLRFFPSYDYLRELVDTKKYGEVTGAYFFRGGGTPLWSWDNWLLKKEKSGGCLLDQHIHDVDTINWLFGKPVSVTSNGRNVFPESGYDIVSTRYLYEDGKVVTAEDDWTINGEFGFEMRFRVNFEKGALIYENGEVTEYPHEGEKFIPDFSSENGYYLELKYFAEQLAKKESVNGVIPLESAADTVYIAEKEIQSCDLNGEVVAL